MSISPCRIPCRLREEAMAAVNPPWIRQWQPPFPSVRLSVCLSVCTVRRNRVPQVHRTDAPANCRTIQPLAALRMRSAGRFRTGATLPVCRYFLNRSNSQSQSVFVVSLTTWQHAFSNEEYLILLCPRPPRRGH